MVSKTVKGKDSYDLELADEKDLERLAGMHQKAFKGLFSSDMGKGFLKGLYKNIIYSDAGVCYAVRDPNTKKVVGFIAGTSNEKNLLPTSFKIKSVYNLLLAVLRNPRTFTNVLRYIKKTRISSGINTRAELISIALEEEYQGKGLGSELVKTLEAWLRAEGIEKYKVFTDTKYSKGHILYEKIDFRLEKKFDLFGIENRCYVKKL